MTINLPTNFLKYTASNLLSFEGTEQVAICRTYDNDKAIIYSFELLTIHNLTLKLKVLESFKTLGIIQPMTQNNIPEELNLQQHRFGELNSRKS
jgi:hypothetical protein